MMRHLVAVSFVAAAIGVAACSGSAGSSCGNYLDSAIAYASKCGTSTGAIDSTAKSGFESYCNAVTKAPGVNNFSGQIDQCNSKVQSADCNTTVNCNITGTLADGAGCGVSFQCAGGQCDNTTTLVPNSEVTCGKCASYVAVGGSCSNNLAACDPTTSECMNGTCVALAQQGQSCASAPCAFPLQCDPTAHTCKPLPTKGQSCATTFECQPPYKCINTACVDPVQQGGACPTGNECASNLVCNTQSKQCEQPTLAGAGQPCGLVQNQNVDCQSGLKCQTNGASSGTCVTLKNAGDACTVGQSECAIFLLCINGTCQVPDYSVCK